MVRFRLVKLSIVVAALSAGALAVSAYGLSGASVARSATPAGGTSPIALAADSSYYVFVLTNVATPGNIWVGQVADLAGKNTCAFADGGLCADQGGQDVAVTYTENLGPYATCAAATDAYNAAAMNPHPAFGGEKVYIFGNSYFIDNMAANDYNGGWCSPQSTTTTTTSTTTTTTTTTSTTTTTAPVQASLPVPTSFCNTSSAHAALAPQLPKVVCAPRRTRTIAEKDDSREELRGELLVALIFCQGRLAPFHENAIFFTECPIVLRLMADTLVEIHDPPASSYQQVALVAAVPPLPPAGGCPGGVNAAACAAVGAAEVKYAAAAQNTAVVGAAAAQSADRFAGALRAKSVSGAFLQAALGKLYGGALAGEIVAQEAAGKALAAALRSAGLDAPLSAAAAANAVVQQGSTVFSSGLLGELVADGVAATPAAARQAITAQLTAVTGTLDPAAALGSPTPYSAYVGPFESITLSDLAAIVKALAAQGVVARTTAAALLGDLVHARAACGKAAAFGALIRKFSATATARVTGAAGGLLPFAARPLAVSTVPASACA